MFSGKLWRNDEEIYGEFDSLITLISLVGMSTGFTSALVFNIIIISFMHLFLVTVLSVAAVHSWERIGPIFISPSF